MIYKTPSFFPRQLRMHKTKTILIFFGLTGKIRKFVFEHKYIAN